MKTVLISGASVAGTSLANRLGNLGFDVTVVERAAAPREGGYAVDVRGCAIDVLDRLGVLPAARSLQTDTLGTSFLSASGEAAATMPRGFGVISASDLEIMRGDLVRILYQSSLPVARYQFSDSVAELEEDADGVAVRFESGAAQRFDLVIGADGLHSNVRRLCFGDEADYVQHLGMYMAVFTAPNVQRLDRWQQIYNIPGRVVSVKSDTGNETVKVTVFFTAEKLPLDHRDIATQKRLTTAAFADAGWVLPRLMEAMQSAEDFYFDATCQVRMQSWSSGRVCLVGDAAACPSPLAGQGSSMALTAAYVLAEELAAVSGDHMRAFVRYEERVRPYIEQNLKVSRDLAAGFTPASRVGIWARNIGLALMRRLPYTEQVMKFAMRDLIKATVALQLTARA